MNYRKRIYESFVSKHWAYTHSLKEEEYELYAKSAKKRYENILLQDKGANIIDIACGGGHFLYFLQQQGYIHTQGIDISQEQLDVAEKMGVKNLQKEDFGEYLPKCLGKFDMIIANDIIEHLTKDEVLNFLDTIYNSLKPRGHILIGVPNVQCLFSGKPRYCDFTHEQGFTPGSLSQVLRICDFQNIKVYGEEPVIHDLRSFIRAMLWQIVKSILKVYLIIESGTGRGLWKKDYILEPKMFAVGEK